MKSIDIEIKTYYNGIKSKYNNKRIFFTPYYSDRISKETVYVFLFYRVIKLKDDDFIILNGMEDITLRTNRNKTLGIVSKQFDISEDTLIHLRYMIENVPNFIETLKNI